MAEKLVYGIQQVGIGVIDAQEAMHWYAKTLGAMIKVFDDNSEATEMAPYMGGMPHQKRAIMTLNPAGGGGFELWQYLDREPQNGSSFTPGDLGINHIKVKTRDASASSTKLRKNSVKVLSEIRTDPEGFRYFYIQDLYGNQIQITEFPSWYSTHQDTFGGVCGCAIGVSNMERSLPFYAELLGYKHVSYDQTVEENGIKLRKVKLKSSVHSNGRFGAFLGDSWIELIQRLDQTPQAIFSDRHWGDLGFIHLCFDVYNMDQWIRECDINGYPFRVISKDSFLMGDTNSRWGYIEDPDGTLIEMVETQRIPILKFFNWYNNLLEKDPHKPLPRWLTSALSLKKIKA